VKYRDQAKAIPDDILSAKAYDGNLPILYALLSYRNKYYWALYDVKHRELLDKKKDIELLSLIRAEESTPVAAADPVAIENFADKCIHKWCEENNANEDEVLRICTMLLLPDSINDFGIWLDQ
jgi:hypothetical protein